MSQPTAQQVLDLARSTLGDEAVSGGEIYTNAILLPFLNAANREMFRVLETLQLPRVKTYAYYNLPAHTGVLYPATASITDLHEPESVATRSVTWTMSVVDCAITDGVPTLEFAPGDGIVTWGVDQFGAPYIVTQDVLDGSQVVVWGVGGITGVGDAWAVTVPDPTHLTLNGAVAAGTYTSGGYASGSTDRFTDLEWVDDVGVDEGNELNRVAWIGGAFRFPPSTEARQLRIAYWSSAPSVTSVNDVIAVDDCIDYLVARTAGQAAFSRGAPTVAEGLALRALGPTGQADGSGGLLRQLFVNAVLREQSEQPIRRKPFRGKRSVYPSLY